ncbi:MAG: phasin family protein [Pseudomonadota bacterium]
MPGDKDLDKTGPDTAALDALTDLQAAGFGTLAAMGSAFAGALNEMGSEAVGFMARRLEHDLETQRRIFACTDLDALRAVQVEFVERSLAQYSDETGRLLEIGDRMVKTAVERSQS